MINRIFRTNNYNKLSFETNNDISLHLSVKKLFGKNNSELITDACINVFDNHFFPSIVFINLHGV